ncbi:unnamed protein product, partial [marine sediment metagenome]
GETLAGLIKGWSLGLGRITSWKGVNKNYDVAKRRYIEVVLNKADREEKIWSKIRTAILDKFLKENFITTDEYRRMLSEDFKAPPVNLETRERLQYFFTTLFMKIPRVPDWDKMPSLTVCITATEEKIIFHLNDDGTGPEHSLNYIEDGTSLTKLTHLISRHPDEWKNLLERIRGKGISEAQVNFWNNLSGVDQFEFNIDTGLSATIKQEIIEMVEDWANMRFQPVYRTIKGLFNIWDAYELYAKICFPEHAEDKEFIEKKVSQKLQLLMAYFLYIKHENDVEGKDIRKL